MLCSATRPALRDRDRLLGQLEHLARLALQHQQLARLALKPAAGPAGELETLGGTLGPPTSLGWQSLEAEPAGKIGGGVFQNKSARCARACTSINGRDRRIWHDILTNLAA